MEHIKRNLLTIVWISVFLGVIILTYTIGGKSTQFYGIASSHEQSISFQHPVEIMRIPVVEGEAVQQGQVLIEVRRPDLDSELSIIDNRIAEIKTRHSESISKTRARLESLRAKQRERLAEIDTQIQTLESRYKLNRKLLGEITGREEEAHKQENDSPILTELNGLKRERSHISRSLQAEIRNLEERLRADIRPADLQISELEKRRNVLLRQVENLRVRANFPGNVGSILYKTGETVAPFKPIVTLHSMHPNYVKGYIHEEVHNEVEIGQAVWIRPLSAANKHVTIEAFVESLGSRIVEYPDRLKRNAMVSAWGREAVIRLPETSVLLLGEKVHISTTDPGAQHQIVSLILNGLSEAVSNSYAVDAEGETMEIASSKPITSSLKNFDAQRIEASGVLWNPASQSYLLISDETPGPTPFVYEMNDDGRIVAGISIHGAGEVDDMESISSDGEYFYIASSLSHNKKGALNKKRRKFLRLVWKDKSFEAKGIVDLHETLQGISSAGTTDREAGAFLSRAIENRSLDIEAHAVDNGALYLGIKTPLHENSTLILKVSDIDSLFSGHAGDTTIWRKLRLTDPVTNKPTLLTDMLVEDNHITLLSVTQGPGRKTSYLWRQGPAPGRPSIILAFPDEKAEGLGLSAKGDSYMVVFDGGGSAPSRYRLVPRKTITRHI